VSTVESFEGLGAVPDVSWRSRARPDPRFAGARPVPRSAEKAYEGGPQVRWLDVHGRPLAEEWAWRDSPVQLLTESFYELAPQAQLELALAALEVPGTRADYDEALGYAERTAHLQDPPDFALLEELLWAHAKLVLGDPAACVARYGQLERAGEPLIALSRLYQCEGFLGEAAAVEMLLEQLPEEARPRYLRDARPQALLEALRGLT
jgi:hypothetical protein